MTWATARRAANTKYMTVYADSPTDVMLSDVEDALVPEGYQDKVSWPKDVSGTTTIGSIQTVDATVEPGYIGLKVSTGVGLYLYIDGLSPGSYVSDKIPGFTHVIQYGTYTVSLVTEAGYDGSKATVTVNGVAVPNGGTFKVDVGEEHVTIIASGAVADQSGGTIVVKDDDSSLTDYLLIILVIVIVVMAILVAMRMMRS